MIVLMIGDWGEAPLGKKHKEGNAWEAARESCVYELLEYPN